MSMMSGNTLRRLLLRCPIQKGIWSVWAFLSVGWLVLIATVMNVRLVALFGPPVGVGIVFWGLSWIVSRSTSDPWKGGRRAYIDAKGLLLRLRNQDDCLVTIPTVQMFNDMLKGTDNEGLADAFPEWAAGKNGPLDDLYAHPTLFRYIQSWATDNTLACFAPERVLPAEQRCYWLSPDMKKGWFLLPDEELVDIDMERLVADMADNADLSTQCLTWMRGSPLSSTLPTFPLFHSYLVSHSSTARLLTTVTDSLLRQ